MKIQQEVKEKEALLEQCYIRMERGEAPDTETEKEWLKTLRDEQRRTAEKRKKKEVLQPFPSTSFGNSGDGRWGIYPHRYFFLIYKIYYQDN